MSESAVYRKLAEECRAKAARVTEPDYKRQLEERAQDWLALARNAKQRELLGVEA
jgi:hypothetical protein